MLVFDLNMIELFTGSNDLFKNIGKYNNALSVVSFDTKITTAPGYGSYRLRIQSIHHRISLLYVDKCGSSSFGQL